MSHKCSSSFIIMEMQIKIFENMGCLRSTKQLTTNTGGNEKKVKEDSFTVGVTAD